MQRLLAVLLVVVEPAGLALAASGHTARVIDRGGLVVVLLAVRLVITSFGIAAGMALWQHRAAAWTLVRWALGLQLAAMLLTDLTPFWPRNLPPGIRGPANAVVIAWYAAWFLWALRQRNVRSADR
jgi:hypothetical protein